MLTPQQLRAVHQMILLKRFAVTYHIGHAAFSRAQELSIWSLCCAITPAACNAKPAAVHISADIAAVVGCPSCAGVPLWP